MEKNVKRESAKPETEDEKLDEALANTFPASDPPWVTDPNKRVGRARPPTARNRSRKAH
jgi:hypothetical protein